jgi:ribonucleoside-triphosphate reductase
MSHLVPFVEVSRRKIREEVTNEIKLCNGDLNKVNDIVEARLKKEINKGIQTIQYQVVTIMTTNGQAPFITLFMYINGVPEGQQRDDLAMIIEEILNQRIQGVKNERGVYITPAFPKLIYVLDDNNINEDSKYYYLTKLAAKCTAKRMVPDYISAKVMRELKQGNVYTCMGCRSFLTVEDGVRNPDGSHKFYGRFNQGVVTINLVDVACSSGRDMNKFWDIFESRLELCHKALRKRHERLLGTVSDVAPICWQHGAIARLAKGEKIDKLLYGGYSTLSLGYAGLYECVYYMTGKSHTDPDVKDFALAVMQKLNDKCAEWRAAENIAYSVYGTPLESTTYKFAKCLQKRFGIIKGVTDHNYITNSYHISPREKISARDKLIFESEFQKLSPGGAISYVEASNLENNIEAVLDIIRVIYENIMYAEINIKSDYCHVCGSTNEIQIIEDDNGKLIWECPNCGNRDQSKMNVARRTCGYVGSNFWNQGRTEEIRDRYVHADNHDFDLEAEVNK